MKRFLSLLAALTILLTPFSSYADYATKSLHLVAASDQYAAISDNASLSITGNLTLESWIYINSSPGTGVAYAIESKYLSTGSQRSYFFTYRDDGGGTKELSLIVSSTGGTGAGITNFNHVVTLSTATWYHVAVVYTTAGTAEFIINGVSVETVSGGVTSIFDGTAAFRVGETANADSPFDGNISLARVWSTTRTAAQIAANYCTILGATSNLQAEWVFDSAYTDNSGNSNTLSPGNSPTFTSLLPPTCSAATPPQTPRLPFLWLF